MEATLANNAFPVPGVSPVGFGYGRGVLTFVYVRLDEKSLDRCNVAHHVQNGASMHFFVNTWNDSVLVFIANLEY